MFGVDWRAQISGSDQRRLVTDVSDVGTWCSQREKNKRLTLIFLVKPHQEGVSTFTFCFKLLKTKSSVLLSWWYKDSWSVRVHKQFWSFKVKQSWSIEGLNYVFYISVRSHGFWRRGFHRTSMIDVFDHFKTSLQLWKNKKNHSVHHRNVSVQKKLIASPGFIKNSQQKHFFSFSVPHGRKKLLHSIRDYFFCVMEKMFFILFWTYKNNQLFSRMLQNWRSRNVLWTSRLHLTLSACRRGGWVDCSFNYDVSDLCRHLKFIKPSEVNSHNLQFFVCEFLYMSVGTWM